MNPLKLATILPLLAMGLLAAPDADAYSVLINWNAATTKYGSGNTGWTRAPGTVSGVGEGAWNTALTAAFESWNDVPCSTLNFVAGGVKTSAPSAGIYITIKSGVWDPSVGDALAYASSQSAASGQIQRTDIVFNNTEPDWTTSSSSAGKTDVQAVATHEIGHALGLNHSRHLEATMWFQGGGPAAATLSEDDKHGACFLYPKVAFTDGQACDACQTSSQCAEGLCLGWTLTGHAYCGQDCVNTWECPADFTCTSIDATISNQCIPDNGYCHPFGANVAVGEFCFSPKNCASGLCVTDEIDAYCSQTCSGSCPGGLSCLNGYCRKTGTLPYGASCEGNTQCESAACVNVGAGDICTDLCGPGEPPCPDDNQCLSNSVCIPPGEGAVGTPCSKDAQCAGTYCNSGKCTQLCGDGCPDGTECDGTFCDGLEAGLGCTESSQCLTDQICQYSVVGADGECAVPCNPVLLTSGCAEGEVCAWVWQSWSATVTGRCSPSNGGPTLGESCGPDAACAQDLVCIGGGEAGAVCRRDCDVSTKFGCIAGESCTNLGFPNDPKHGACLPKTIPTKPVDAGPTPDASAPDVATPDGGQADMGEAPEVGPNPTDSGGTDTVPQDGAAPGPETGVEPLPVPGAGGCAGGAPLNDALPLLMGVAMALWAARRRSIQLDLATATEDN